VWLTQFACQNNILVAYMHMRLIVNGVLKYFLRKVTCNWLKLTCCSCMDRNKEASNNGTYSVLLMRGSCLSYFLMMFKNKISLQNIFCMLTHICSLVK
jgi:hypothetical protein